MTKRMILWIHAAEVSFLRKVAGLSFRVRSSDIRRELGVERRKVPDEVVWASDQDVSPLRVDWGIVYLVWPGSTSSSLKGSGNVEGERDIWATFLRLPLALDKQRIDGWMDAWLDGYKEQN